MPRNIYLRKLLGDLDIAPGNGDGFVMGSGGNLVDLASLTVVKNGEMEITLEKLLRDPDTSRLFGDLSSAKDLKVAGSTATFIHPAYGEVFVTEVPAAEGENFILKIKRSDGGVYIPPSAVKDINLPACFGGDDFTVWGYPDGSLKICDKNDPNKILYASEGGGSGKLHRVPQSNPEEFIEFYDYGTAPKVDLISEYESPDKCIFFCAESGTRVRIEFPRYKDANGNTLSVKKSGNEWVLSSSPNLNLVQAPQLQTGNNERTNPLMGYEGAIWLENRSNPGTFKCLLPSIPFTRIKEGGKRTNGDYPRIDSRRK